MKRTGFARRLRRGSTDAERRLWFFLRGRRFAGFKFRRQVPVGNYVADLLCYEVRLIVELDGGQHAVRRPQDARRDAYLRRQGFCVLRIPDNLVFKEREVVLEAIWKALHETRPQEG